MEILINGLLLSLCIAFTAIGFVLLFGTSRIFDLNYGGYYLLAGYVGVSLYSKIGIGAAILAAIVSAILLALFTHRFIIWPLRTDRHTVLIATAAFMMIIAHAFVLIYGSEFYYFPPLVEGSINILGAIVVTQRLVAALVAAALIVLLWLFLTKTKIGSAIRAVEQQPEAAQLVGVEPRRVQFVVAAVAAFLVALAAILITPIGVLHPHMWLDIIVLSSAIVVVGGLGSIWGCLLAAMIVGFSQTLVSFLMPGGGFLKQGVYLMIMVIILLIRPWGLFGLKEES